MRNFTFDVLIEKIVS